jgi:hypothetical protein
MAEVYNERMRKLRRSHARASARLGLIIRRANDELPISEKHLALARIYAARTSALDPLVNAALRLVEEFPEGLSLLEPLVDGVREAIDSIERNEADRTETTILLQDFARRNEKSSRVWRQVGDNHGQADALVDDANATVHAWSDRMKQLLPSGSST